MSTIRSSDPASGRRLEIKAAGGDTLWLAVDGVNQGGTPGTDVVVSTSAVLAAVATECDAIVIPRADLPEVRRVHDGIRVDGFYRVIDREFGDHDAHTARGAALRLLALAEYLAAHPPVDEAQVEALAEAMRSAQNLSSIPEVTRDFARRLVAAGVRIEVTP